MKLTVQKISYYTLTLALVGATGYITQVHAQPTKLGSNPANSTQVHLAQLKPPDKAGKSRIKRAPVRFVLPKLPDAGIPTGRQRGAAARGTCPAADLPLTAFVPAVEQTSGEGQGKPLATTNVWGLTVAEYPTFWFYVPYAQASAHFGEFVLQDEGDNDVYRTPVTLPGTPGTVGIRLPSTSAPLEIGKRYHWYFKIYCNPQRISNPVNPIFVEGWVQRVTPNPTLISQLTVATPKQQIALYAANGIWYEALTSLAELRLVEPNDPTLEADWADLLRSISLDNVASQPIVQCCTPEK